MQPTPKSKARQARGGVSKHKWVRDAVCDMFHPATVDQVQELLRHHRVHIGKSSILRVIRRLVRRGTITAFLDREPPEYMKLLDSKKCKDTRGVA